MQSTKASPRAHHCIYASSYCVVIQTFEPCTVFYLSVAVCGGGWGSPTRRWVISVYVMSGPRLCTLAPCVWGNVPSHLFPRRLGLVVWTSLKPFEARLIASCMAVWGGGVFPPLDIQTIMSATLSLTFGALHARHASAVKLLSMWGREAKMASRCYLTISAFDDILI